MKKQITNISIHQSSKVFALMAFFVSLIIFIPVGLFLLLFGQAPAEGDRMAAVALLFMPLLYLVFAYVSYVVIFFLYNIVAQAFGGFEVTIEDKETHL